MSATNNGTMSPFYISRSVLSAVQRALSICVLNKLPCSLALFDVQNMTTVNQRHGRNVGSEFLTMYARLLATLATHPAEVLRCGGDEFAILMPGLDPDRSVAFIRRVQNESGRTMLRATSGSSVCLAARVGGATSVAQKTTPQALIQAADNALASAKHSKATRLQWRSVASTA
jgi:diguanylate cyclase (GGDEF)-like protein